MNSLKRLDPSVLGFILLALGSFLTLKLSGQLNLRTDNDTASYLEPTLFRFPDALENIRTLGYPWFLKAVQTVSPYLQALPLAHLLAHLLAILLFIRGLRSLRVPGSQALTIASPLFFSPMLLEYGGAALTDCLGSSFALGTMGAFLGLMGHPQRFRWWLAFGVGQFLTYQTRPVYLCMVPFFPALGFLLLRYRAKQTGVDFPARKVATGMLAVCLGPFLAFCTLRWVVVSHFGLVSFGGRNIIGIPGQFMTHDLVPRLPTDLQSTALSFLDRREEVIQEMYDRKLSMTPPRLMKGWQPVPTTASQVNYRAVGQMYNPTISVYYYLLQKKFGDNEVVINNKLTTISLAVILYRPKLYLAWLAKAFWHAVSTLIGNAMSSQSLCLLMALALLFGTSASFRIIWSSPRSPAPAGILPVLPVLFLVAVGFALCNIVLVVLVEIPIDRYMNAAGVLLPTLPMAALASRWAARPGCVLRSSVQIGETAHV